MAITLVILMTSSIAAVLGDSLCLIDNCSVCNSTFAICVTQDPNMPIPNNLNPNIVTLYIGYTGPNTTLTAKMLSPYQNLHSFSITGDNIESLESRVFANTKLRRVEVIYTAIKSLPDDTFGKNSNVYALFLGYNKLRNIPTNIFHSLGELILLDLSYNPELRACNSSKDGHYSIGEEFKNLSKLDILHVAGLGEGDLITCKNITPKYFDPVSQIRQINLSDTGFFYSKHAPQMLSSLTNLTSLSLNHVFPYAECPALAEDLFSNLSSNLEILQVRGWRTTKAVNKSCILTNQTLQGLKLLPNVTILDFKYSDQIFGNELKRTLFEGFHRLRNLELSWCRLTSIEDGALQSLFHLETLNLKGNQLASREFWVYDKNNTISYPLWAIELRHCGIDSDETFTYNAYYLFRSFPNLEIIDLSHNEMYVLPLFTDTGMPLLKSNVRSLDMSVNILSHLSGNDVKEMCVVMSNLKILKANDNMIVDISGLDSCQRLEELHIMINLLSTPKYQNDNFKAIKKLHRLKYLDLSKNGIKSIPPDLFHKMENLTTLYLMKNNLVTFDNSMLIHNHHLSVVRFSFNQIQIFNYSILSENKFLTELWIDYNLIEVLDEGFVDFVENQATNLVNIRVDGNPFDCSCGKLYVQHWVNTTTKIEDPRNMKCERPYLFRYKPVYNYSESFYICRVKTPFELTCGITAVILLSILITVPSYRYRWYIRHARVVFRAMSDRAKDMKTEDECDYDVMICFNENSDEDLNWVKDDLLVNIEGGEYNSMNFDDPDDRVSVMIRWSSDSKLGLLIGGYSLKV